MARWGSHRSQNASISSKVSPEEMFYAQEKEAKEGGVDYCKRKRESRAQLEGGLPAPPLLPRRPCKTPYWSPSLPLESTDNSATNDLATRTENETESGGTKEKPKRKRKMGLMKPPCDPVMP